MITDKIQTKIKENRKLNKIENMQKKKEGTKSGKKVDGSECRFPVLSARGSGHNMSVWTFYPTHGESDVNWVLSLV